MVQQEESLQRKKITSNMFILFSKARENKRTARIRGQVEASYLQQASWEMGFILIQGHLLCFCSV